MTITNSDLVNITETKIHDQYGIGQLVFKEQLVEDRAYFDFTLHRIQAENIFVTRIKTYSVI
jgi:hypothetical protein